MLSDIVLALIFGYLLVFGVLFVLRRTLPEPKRILLWLENSSGEDIAEYRQKYRKYVVYVGGTDPKRAALCAKRYGLLLWHESPEEAAEFDLVLVI